MSDPSKRIGPIPDDPTQPLEKGSWEKYAKYRGLLGLDRKAATIQIGSKAKNPHKWGYQIEQRPEVAARIAYWRDIGVDEARKTVSYEQEDIVREMWATFRQARVMGQSAAAINALRLLGVQLGMFVEKRETASRKIDPLDGLSDADLKVFIQKSFAELGLTLDLSLIERALHQSATAEDGTIGPGASGEEAGHLPASSEADGVAPTRQ